MIEMESHADLAAKSSPANMIPPEFVTMGKNHFEGLAKIQTELIERLGEANRSWLDRMQSEATLASEFSSKLTASHSIADGTAACQEWAKRRMELFTEDGQRLMTNSQKFMEKATQFLSNG